MPTALCTAKASYKKSPGVLELTDSHIQWFADGKKAPSVRVAHADAACMSFSDRSAVYLPLF